MLIARILFAADRSGCAGFVWIADEGRDQKTAEGREADYCGMRLKCDICKNGLMSGAELSSDANPRLAGWARPLADPTKLSCNSRSGSGSIHNTRARPNSAINRHADHRPFNVKIHTVLTIRLLQLASTHSLVV